MAEHTQTHVQRKKDTHRQSQPREHPTERCAEAVELLQEVADIIPHTLTHTHLHTFGLLKSFLGCIIVLNFSYLNCITHTQLASLFPTPCKCSTDHNHTLTVTDV